VGVNHPFNASQNLQNLPYCNTIARPLHNVHPPTEPSLFAIHHTILVLAISWSVGLYSQSTGCVPFRAAACRPPRPPSICAGWARRAPPLRETWPPEKEANIVYMYVYVELFVYICMYVYI